MPRNAANAQIGHDPDIVDARELGAKLRLSLKVVYALANNGAIPGIRTSAGKRGHWRFSYQAVRAAIAALPGPAPEDVEA